MSEIIYYTLDTETTGLSTSMHEVFQISLIRNSDRKQLTRRIICDHPENASLDALKITGMTKKDLYEGYSKQEAIEHLERFFNEDKSSKNFRCIVAHNANFDKRFCHSLWEKVNKEFPADMWIDTMAMSRDLQKGLGIAKPKTSLADSCQKFNIIKRAGQHEAKVDCQNAYLLYVKLITEGNIDFLKYIKNDPHKIITSNDIDKMLEELDGDDYGEEEGY